MIYTYYLPDNSNNKIEHITDDNSILIIGANGSGKSKLGAWIEQSDIQHTHRIGAQRSLTFGHYIQQMSYEQATCKLLFGSDNQTPDHNHNERWGWDGEKYNYTANLLNDYESVLSAIWAKKIKQESEYIEACKVNESNGQPHNQVPEIIIDILKRVWTSIFPQRNIEIVDGKVRAIFTKEGEKLEYKGRDMSDGERVALYLICQSLCVPENKVIIIDEPELHLHRSIMNRLWTAIEKERQDCLFIYITHDTQFAANHKQAKKIWVKSFDGENWDFDEVNTAALPEQLLFEIMGNRRKVLFVEGEADSFDTKLYSELYNQYYVVPCGSCSKVIEQTKAMKSNPQLHDLKCFGIIDRDYRCEEEIVSLRNSDVYTLKVSEVENLFIVEELLQVVNSIQGYNDSTNIQNVKRYIIENRYAQELNRQICAATISEIKYILSSIDISGSSDDAVKQTMQTFFNIFSYDAIKELIEKRFNEAKDTQEYTKILALFNRKSLKDSVGHYFGLRDNDYCNFIIRHLHGRNATEIKNALRNYFPEEIPM